MKITVAIIALLLGIGSSAFALTTAEFSSNTRTEKGASIAGSKVSGGSFTMLGKLSTGVTAKIKFDPTAYALSTKHTSGNKVFGTANDSTAIFFTTVSTDTIEDLLKSDNTAFNSWTSM